MMEFPCLYCGQLIRAEEGLADKRVECPGCGHSVVVRQRKPGAALRSAAEAQEERQDTPSWEGLSDQEIAGSLLSKRRTKEEQQREALKTVLSPWAPRYDDLTLFALSLSFVLLWYISTDLRQDLVRVFLQYGAGSLPIWLIIAVIGMMLSLVNVFLRREKSGFEKYAMLMFAVVVTAGTGFYAGWIMLHQGRSWRLIFPAWNILNAGLLVLLFRLGVIDADCVADEPASVAEVVLTAVCVPVVLTVCHYHFELHWAVTFSITVAYTLSLHNGLRDVTQGAISWTRRSAP